ncbi:MAG: class I SAM-dependent methyltransferase, partial [Sedimentisphaerales bacterium]|nr:class I SAM-dependent methyltransferase [Sedimentisphaerales bacterium]
LKEAMMTRLPVAKLLLKKIYGCGKVYSYLKSLIEYSRNPFLRSKPPGHYYSPIPDLHYVQMHRSELFARDKTSCPGIHLNVQKQLGLIKELAMYYSELPFSGNREKGKRYYYNNSYFGCGSAVILYSLMRHFLPRRIIEIGSGYSSAAMLDVNDCFFNQSIKFSFVEPYPDRLLSLLTESDRAKHTIYADIVQNVQSSVFAELGVNDILFIDSSHVAKIGSDVVYLVTEIMPTLPKGVIVHIHDIYWPFEYPEDWVMSGRGWNEAYLLKAFLQFNDSFEVLLFNSYLAIHQQDIMTKYLPLFLPKSGSSLWIRKIS